MLSKRAIWRRTPPAIFPVCLGLMGLGLGWHGAADVLPVPHEIGNVLLGSSAAFFLFFLALYLRKIAARPAVLFEDLTTSAARAGIAAAAMSVLLLSAVLSPLGLSVPQVWWVGVVLQVAVSVVLCRAIWQEPSEERQFTPYQYLTFVGPVVGLVAGVPMGYVVQSYWLILAALVAHIIITVGWGLRLMRTRPAVPLRPSVAIFLAPNCLFALGFGLLGVEGAFYAFYWIANCAALMLIVLFSWMTNAGWTPVWAAFTFPAAAFLNVQVMAMKIGAGTLAVIGVYASLTIATPLILYIVYRFVVSWASGELAEKTGAAQA